MSHFINALRVIYPDLRLSSTLRCCTLNSRERSEPLLCPICDLTYHPSTSRTPAASAKRTPSKLGKPRKIKRITCPDQTPEPRPGDERPSLGQALRLRRSTPRRGTRPTAKMMPAIRPLPKRSRAPGRTRAPRTMAREAADQRCLRRSGHFHSKPAKHYIYIYIYIYVYVRYIF